MFAFCSLQARVARHAPTGAAARCRRRPSGRLLRCAGSRRRALRWAAGWHAAAPAVPAAAVGQHVGACAQRTGRRGRARASRAGVQHGWRRWCMLPRAGGCPLRSSTLSKEQALRAVNRPSVLYAGTLTRPALFPAPEYACMRALCMRALGTLFPRARARSSPDSTLACVPSA